MKSLCNNIITEILHFLINATYTKPQKSSANNTDKYCNITPNPSSDSLNSSYIASHDPMTKCKMLSYMTSKQLCQRLSEQCHILKDPNLVSTCKTKKNCLCPHNEDKYRKQMYSSSHSEPWHYLPVSGKLHAPATSPLAPNDRRLGGAWSQSRHIGEKQTS